MRRVWLSLLIVCLPEMAEAQTQQQLDKAVRFGAIATTGPLCGLRDQRWGSDLRQAEMQAMGADGSDPAKRTLRDRAGAALSYAEDEALESFAEAVPEATCKPLAHNPDLTQADQMVAAFRSGAGQPMW